MDTKGDIDSIFERIDNAPQHHMYINCLPVVVNVLFSEIVRRYSKVTKK
jgi:hypothetical protein